MRRVAVLLLLLATAPARAAGPVIERVELVRGPVPMVRLQLSGAASAIAHPLAPEGTTPPRIFIDVAGATLSDRARQPLEGAGSVLRVRSGQFDPKTARVVLDLDRALPYDFQIAGRTITLKVGPAPAAPLAAPPAPPAATPPVASQRPPAVEPAPVPPVASVRPAPVEPAPQAPAIVPPAAPAVVEPPPAAIARAPVPPPVTAPTQHAAAPTPPPASHRPAAVETPPASAVAIAHPSAEPVPSPPTVAKPAVVEPPATVTARAPAPPPVAPEAERPSTPPTAPAEVPPVASASPTPAESTTPAPALTPSAPPAAAESAPTVVAQAPSAPATAPPTRHPATPAHPAPQATPPVPPVIIIDPGHGGRDPGAEGVGGVVEKDVVLELAHRLAAKLAQRLPVSVILTRTEDSYVAVQDRLPAPEPPVALFLSLHANACRDPSPSGVEIFYGGGLWRPASPGASNPRARALGVALARALDKRLGVVRGNARPGPFAVLVRNPAPAALVEVGFLTHPEDAARARAESFQEQLSDALVDGIGAFLQARTQL